MSKYWNFDNEQSDNDILRNVPEQWRSSVIGIGDTSGAVGQENKAFLQLANTDDSKVSVPVKDNNTVVGNALNTEKDLSKVLGALENTPDKPLDVPGLENYNKQGVSDLENNEYATKLGNAITNSNIYKKYLYNSEDVLLEAKKISGDINIPVNAILSSPEALSKSREIYNYRKKITDIDPDGVESVDLEKVYEAYPGLKALAKMDEESAAIALCNLQNVKQVHGIIDNFRDSWKVTEASNIKGKIGTRQMLHTEQKGDAKELARVESIIKNAKEVPSFFDEPGSSMAAGLANVMNQFVSGAIRGNERGVQGAAVGAMYGFASGSIVPGAGNLAGTAAGAKTGYLWGFKEGMIEDMAENIIGNNYLEFKAYKDKYGKPLLSDDEAKIYAVVAGGLETGIEFWHMPQFLKLLGGSGKGAAAGELAKIVSQYKDNKSIKTALVTWMKGNVKELAKSSHGESSEEFVQEISNTLIKNYIATQHPGGNLKAVGVYDMLLGGAEAYSAALPGSFAAALGGSFASNVPAVRTGARAMLETQRVGRDAVETTLREYNARKMLNDLRENLKTNEWFKKDPQSVNEVIKTQLEDVGLTDVHIDTEMLLSQEGGAELVEKLGKQAGLTDEQIQEKIDEKEELTIPTQVFCQNDITDEESKKLQEYITFDPNSQSVARIQQYSRLVKQGMDNVLKLEDTQYSEAVENIIADNFKDVEQMQAAEFILVAYPDNPVAGIEDEIKRLEVERNEMLRKAYETIAAGKGQGVQKINEEDRKGRYSNNDFWYTKWYDDHKRSMTKEDEYELAYNAVTGNDKYGLLGPREASEEADRWYNSQKAVLDDIERGISTFKQIKDKVAEIKKSGELQDIRGLSKEGYQVYSIVAKDILTNALNPEMKKAAVLDAILLARHCDRVAEIMRLAGKKDFTAMDAFKKIDMKYGGTFDPVYRRVLKQKDLADDLHYYCLDKPGELDRQLKAIETLDNMASVSYAGLKVVAVETKEKREEAKAVWRQLYQDPTTQNPITIKTTKGNIIFSIKAFRELFRHSANPNTLKLIPLIPDILDKSILLYSEPPTPSRKKGFDQYTKEYHTYAMRAELDGMPCIIKSIVKVDVNNDWWFYDADVTEIENGATLQQLGTPASKAGPAEEDKHLSYHSIPHWILTVKEYFNNNQINLKEKLQNEDISQEVLQQTSNIINPGTLELNAVSARDKDARAYQEKAWREAGLSEQEIKDLHDHLDNIVNTVLEEVKGYAVMEAWQLRDINDPNLLYRVFNEKYKATFGHYPTRSAFKKNGEYELNIDLGSLCTKRESMDALIQILIKKGYVQNLGPTQMEALKSLLKSKGFLTACDICFVETKRVRALNDANKWSFEWKSVLLAAGIDDGVQLGTNRELTAEQLHRLEEMAGPNYEEAYNKYMSEDRKRVKTPNGKADLDTGITSSKMKKIAQLMLEDTSLAGEFKPELLLSTAGTDWLFRSYTHTNLANTLASMFGAATAKPLEGFNIYDALSWFRDFDSKNINRDHIYNIGGFRAQSFTDFNPILFVDYVQMFTDLEARRLPIHIYTKVPSLIELFGMTGGMFNMSLVPEIVDVADPEHAGLKQDENGNWVYAWANESFPVERAMELRRRKEYGGRVGTIAVGVSDAHILMMLDDENIDMIIPYHSSGMPASVKTKTGLNKAKDYTNFQNTKGLKEGEKDFSYNKALRELGDPRKAADAYLKWCKDNHYTPKFEKFKNHENYYKLLEDFRGYDNEGNAVIQGPVRLKLPDNFGEILRGALAERGEQDVKRANMESNEDLMNEALKILEPQRLDGEIRDQFVKRLRTALGKNNVVIKKNSEFLDMLEASYAESIGVEAAKSRVEVFRMENGIVYGYAKNGQIVLNENYMNANTPAHEFSHVWAKVAQIKNPQLWAEGVELLKQSDTWQEVMEDELYDDIKGDENAVASEVLARIVGKENEEYVRRLVDPNYKMAKGKGLQTKIMEWVHRMFEEIRSLFDDVNGHQLTYDEFIHMPLKTLWDNKEAQRFRNKSKGIVTSSFMTEAEMMAERQQVFQQAAGVNAKTANMEMLEKAQAMLKAGSNNAEILKETGWYHGKDGQWRFEIPDNLEDIDYGLLKDIGKQSVTLGELYDNERLFQAYPELADFEVREISSEYGANVLGYISPGENVIYLRTGRKSNEMGKTLVHEIQHVIQGIEGFASGGNPNTAEQLVVDQWKADRKYLKELQGKDKEYFALLMNVNALEEAEKTQIMGAITGNNTWEALNETKAKLAEAKAKLESMEIDDSAKDKIDLAIQRVKDYRKKFGLIADDDSYFGIEVDKNLVYKNLLGEVEARAAADKAEYYTENGEELTDELVTKIVGFHNSQALVVFGDSVVDSIDTNPLQSNDGSTTRGIYYQTAVGKHIIHLFNTANESTFAHEMGHYFLQELKELAEMEGAPAQVKRDWETVKKWLDYKDDQTELTEEQQEKWARGWERYLRNGVAPATSLQRVFASFKKWLTNIYRDVTMLGEEPSPAVKRVMDRMIATEQEIEYARARADYQSFERAGGMAYMPSASVSLYQSLMNKAKEEAEAKVLKIAMKDIGEDYEDKKKKAYQEAEEALYQEGERIAAYVVQEYLKNNPELGLSQVLDILGITQDEYALQLKEYGKDIDAFVAYNMKQWEAAYEAPPKGEALRVLAEEALATSEYQKIVTAMELQTLEKLVKAQARLDKMVREKTGEATAEEAAKAIREMDDREKQKAGLRAYRDDSIGIYKQIKDYVSAKLENMTIKEANDIRKWQRLSKQALDDASNALAAGEWGKAANAKRRQLVYQEFASRAVTNGKKIAQTVETLKKKGEASKRNKNMKAVDSYVFNHMLYVFGLAKKDVEAPPDYTSFSQVLANRDETLENPYVNENGQLILPDWFITAVTDKKVYEGGYLNMTNETFQDVAAVMKVVYKMGTDANKLRYAKDIHGNELKLDEAVRLIGAEAAKETRPIYVSDPTGLGNPSAKDKLYDSWRWCNAWLEKAETTLRKLGPSAIRFIYEPMKEAAIDELKRANELSKQIDEIFSVYSDKEKFDLKHKVVTKLGSSNVTRENLIMIALNYGTVINRKRLMDGHNISGYEIDKALAYLDERDWTLVKKVWDLYEQRWPELVRIEAEASGAILKKQEAVGFNIMDKNGKVHVLQGGYFPIKYDPLKNAVVNERQADAAKMANTASSAMSLGKSMTKERVQGRVSIPLRRDFGVITESLTEQTHLIAMRLAVRDVRRIILNKEFAAIVEQHLGMSAYGALRKWSSDCWAQEPANKSPYERFAQVVRSNSTMAVLGFRTMTAVLNVLNIAPMAHYLTPAGAYAAIKSYYAHPIEQRNFIFSKSTFMAERAETIDRDIAAAIRNSGSYTTKVPGYELIQKSAFKLIAETDLMLANPLWLMEYQKVYHERLFKNGVEQKLPPEQLEREAINAADKAVRTVFGSNMKHDQAQVQRGDEWIKQLTMYYSYFSTVYNALDWAVHESRKANFYKKGVMEQIVPIANGFLFWILIPALGEALIRPIGDDDKDKYTGEKIAGKTAGAVISGLFGGIPLLREFIPHLVAPYLGEKRYDLGSMSWVAFALQVEEITDTMRKMHKGKKDGIDLARETLRLVDYATGLPFTVTDAMTTFLRYADEGFDKDITEFLRAVAFDKQLKSKKK